MGVDVTISKERLAIITALKAKYLGAESRESATGGRRSQDGKGSTTTQEVSGVEVHPSRGEGAGRTDENPPVAAEYTRKASAKEGDSGESKVMSPGVVESPDIMESVNRCITASLKPSDMVDGDGDNGNVDNHNGDNHSITPELITDPTPSLPHTQSLTRRELAIQHKNRGRWFAVVMRLEFDPACLSLDYKQKAELAGLRELSGSDDEDLIFQYMSILNDMEFVASRKKALEAFEMEMDVPTAVSIARAAKMDPQYAIMRRRLRQMDDKRRVLGDQRDQFGQLMAFLRGETESVESPLDTVGGNGNGNTKGIAGVHDEGEINDSGELQEQTDPIANGLE